MAVVTQDRTRISMLAGEPTRMSWGAIFAGAVTALVTQIVVNLVGVGVGLASVGTTAADNTLGRLDRYSTVSSRFSRSLRSGTSTIWV